MGCNCTKTLHGNTIPQGPTRNADPSPQGVPAVAGSKVEFFFVADGVEQAFDKLSEAKSASGGNGIQTRRVPK